MKLTRRRFLALAAGTVAGGGVYACGIEPLWIEIEQIDLTIARLPAAFAGYTIVQLSDLHAGDGVPRSHLRRAVQIANSYAPDLIAVTGDLVDCGGKPPHLQAAAGILGRAKARDGVFAVTGNHDMGVYRDGTGAMGHAVPRLREALDEAGVTLLHNEVHRIERDRAQLRLAGFGDLWSGGFDAGSLRPGACTIALSHNPDTAPELARRRADLVLCGHTHGGQVCLPILGPPWIPLRHKQFLKGHFRLGDTQLYVNRGLGWSHRIRFRARPEITVLRLAAPHA